VARGSGWQPATPICADVSDSPAVARMFDAAEAAFGGVDEIECALETRACARES
jgi:hypothetical protein